MRVRQWQQQDVLHMATLLHPSADPLWVDQFHALHGPDRDGDEWRRTRVAVDARDRLVGCATITRSGLHGSRIPCAVEVVPQFCRRGIGSALVAEMQSLRPDSSRPLSTKVRQYDGAAMAFTTAVGGRTYQCSPRVVVDPRLAPVRRWADSRSARDCTTLEAVPVPELGRAFAGVYEWVHRSWSPVTDRDLLPVVAAIEAADADPVCSAGVWSGSRLIAVAFAFRSVEGFEVVAETIRSDEPDGVNAVADAVAMVMRSVGRHPGALVAFDSHVDDPHLQPVLDDLPRMRMDPLNLIETE